MQSHFLAAEAPSSTSRTLTITLFLVFVAITLAITIWASRQTKTATDFYAGGRSFSGFQNGMAIGGDYMSAASFLGIAGLIALFGYDGFLYSIGFLVAWLVALLLGIKPGTTFLGMDADTAKVATIILVGALMIIYVVVGGMKGTTYVQIVKAFLLMTGAIVMAFKVGLAFKFNLSSLLGAAAEQSGKGDAFLEPGLRYGVE